MASNGSQSPKMDPRQARQIGTLLHGAYVDEGILGSGTPPARRMPKGMDRGDKAHLHFVTLTAAIDYHRDPRELWSAARETVADGDTGYVYDPQAVVGADEDKVRADLQAHGLSSKPNKDADIWRRICATLVEDFGGSVWNLLDEAGFDVPTALGTIRSSTHDFPYLGGRKIGSLWADLLAGVWGGAELTGLQEIPIYIDRDVVAASVTGGALVGPFDGSYDTLKAATELVWTAACEGTDLYPMQFYTPLAELGSRGCREVEDWPCPVRRDCPVMIFCTETRPRKGGEGMTFRAPKRVGTAISL